MIRVLLTLALSFPAFATLSITTTSCPISTQYAAYAGCTIAASGGTPPYIYSVSTSNSFPSLPEGMTINASTGVISSSLIGGQGYYAPEFIVTDSTMATATSTTISFAIQGSNAFMETIFPANSIFHHRMDAASTGLPVDTSPAAPIDSAYTALSLRVFFGNTSGAPFPNGIPAIEVPCSQTYLPVTTTMFQSYFTSGPFPAYAPVEGTPNSASSTDQHVLVYQESGCGNPPALWEMWQGVYSAGAWTDSSNALWANANSNALNQGNGSADAAGLPIAPLLLNADEVIGTGTPSAPNGTVQHPTRFTLGHMLAQWVWPGAQTSGVGNCTGATLNTLISQASPPSGPCTWTGPAGEIYRLKASVTSPTCASTSPQAAIIITAFRNYGIILADNGTSGGIIGTPDTRWNDTDLACLGNLTLANFEPVNVSSLMVAGTGSGATSLGGSSVISSGFLSNGIH